MEMCKGRARPVPTADLAQAEHRVAASGRSSAVLSAGSSEIPNDTAVHAEYRPHKPTHRIHTHARTGLHTHGSEGRGRDTRGNHRQLRVRAVRVDDVEPINRYSRYRLRTT
jgi:hypothetical protein